MKTRFSYNKFDDGRRSKKIAKPRDEAPLCSIGFCEKNRRVKLQIEIPAKRLFELVRRLGENGGLNRFIRSEFAALAKANHYALLDE
jgi:hypothetical protein